MPDTITTGTQPTETPEPVNPDQVLKALHSKLVANPLAMDRASTMCRAAGIRLNTLIGKRAAAIAHVVEIDAQLAKVAADALGVLKGDK